MRNISYIKEFGIDIFISKAIRKLTYSIDSNFAWRINNYNEQKIEAYLEKELAESTVNMEECLQFVNNHIPANPIWTMWWQGEEKASEIVQVCINSMRKHANNHDVIVISEDNVDQYIKLPEFIMEKVRCGEISRTHLSDIVRLNLLYIYGGGWLDATVFVSEDISDDLFEYPFYTIRTGDRTKDPSHGRWSAFAIFCQRNNQIVGKVLELHYKYWKQHQQLVDYVIIDYFIQYVAKQNEEFMSQILNVPMNNKDVFRLRSMFNTPWNGWDSLQIDKETFFHKLSWKGEYSHRMNGRKTVYAYLIDNSKE